MQNFQIFFAAAALAIGGIIMSCGENNNPLQPLSDDPTAKGRTVIYREDFEETPDVFSENYKPLIYWQGLMSLTNTHSHGGKKSITSDSNNTGIKMPLETYITDSIAGIEFYLYATKPQGANFIVAMGQAGSSPNGLSMILGMGIGKSDSLMLYYQQPYPADLVEKNLASLEFNKWNKCNVEYNFKNDTLTCFLNNTVVYSYKPDEDPMQVGQFVVLRDSLGSNGPKDYYADDVTIYQR
jgi:hypothetical protein